MLRRQTSTALLIMALAGACAAPGATPLSSGTPSASLPSPTATAAAAATTAPTPSPTPTPMTTRAPTLVPRTPSPTSTTKPSSRPAATMIVRAYFLLHDTRGEDPALVPVLRTVPKRAATARAAMNALLARPSAKERAAKPAIESFVPAGTRLLGIKIRNGLATVDLSVPFASFAPDAAWDLGSFELRARLAQVTYTLTQFATIRRVSFELDGMPVKAFSAMPDPEDGSTETIAVDKPVTRATYRDRFLPPIFVDRPAWGAALPTPGRVTGLTSVFEARFRVALLDQHDKVLVDVPVLASAGSGTWGAFEVTLDYAVSRAQWGTLRVWTISAADGNAVAVREYPVYLRPAP
jgi:germination protein M